MFTIYTTTQCAYCTMVKKLLTMKNQPFQEIDVTNDPEKRQHAFNLSKMLTVPVVSKTVEGEEKLVCVGWNPKLLLQSL